MRNSSVLAVFLLSYGCSLVAVGNGTAVADVQDFSLKFSEKQLPDAKPPTPTRHSAEQQEPDFEAAPRRKPAADGSQLLSELSSTKREAVLSSALLMLLITIGASLFTSQMLRWKDMPALTDPLVGIAWGALLGAGLHFGSGQTMMVHQALSFNADFFFITLLPPVVFNSGYALSGTGGTYFYKNAGAIVWFATVGTLIAFAITAVGWGLLSLLRFHPASWSECAAVGALFASTDLVPILPILDRLNPTPLLAALVRGESLLNDGVSIALYRAAVSGSSARAGLLDFCIIFFGSIAVGLLMGLLTAILSKHLKLTLIRDESSQVMEAALLLLVVWVSYLIADLISTSGIIAVLFMGLCVSRYTHANLSSTGQRASAELFAVCSLVAETAISVLLGVALFNAPAALLRDALLAAAVGAVVILSRVVSVTLTSSLVNLFRLQEPINAPLQRAMIVCGVKGGVSFALAVRAAEDFEDGRRILHCTLLLAVASITLSSVSLPSLLAGIPRSEEKKARDSVGNFRLWLTNVERIYLQKIFTNSGSGAAPVHQFVDVEELGAWEDAALQDAAASASPQSSSASETEEVELKEQWLRQHADIF